MGILEKMSSFLSNGGHYIYMFVKNITVEPGMMLLVLGAIIAGQPSTTILYRKICETEYAPTTDVNCLELSAYPAVQDKVQSSASEWNLAISGVKTFIGIPAILLWSSWADHKKDRISVLMVPVVGFVISLYIYLLENQMSGMPVWFLVFASGITSCSGGLYLLINSVNAYLADRFENKKWLAIRFSMILACVQLVAVIGAEVDGLLTRLHMDLSWIIIVGLVLIVLSQLYFGLVLTNISPVVKNDTKIPVDYNEKTFVHNDSTEKPTLPAPALQRQKSVFVTTADLLKDTYHTFSRPRPQNRRTFIMLILMASFLAGVADDGTFSTKNLFLYRRPLNFTFEEYSTLTSGSSGMALVGTVVATTVFKLFGWVDTSLAIVSLIFNIGSNLIFAFSRTKLMVWMSSLVNSIGYLFSAALSSMIIKLGEPHEQATLIAGTGVASSLASFVSSIMFNAIYSQTESSRPWIAWVAAAAIISLGLLCVIFVHIQLKRQSSTIDRDVSGGEGQIKFNPTIDYSVNNQINNENDCKF